MGRRKIGPDEEMALAKAAEASSAAGADLTRVEAGRGPNATAVLSVRLPLEELQALREIARKRSLSLSEVVQEAVSVYAATGGPQQFVSAAQWTFYAKEPAKSEAYNPAPKEWKPQEGPETVAGPRRIA